MLICVTKLHFQRNSDDNMPLLFKLTTALSSGGRNILQWRFMLTRGWTLCLFYNVLALIKHLSNFNILLNIKQGSYQGTGLLKAHF